MITKAGVAIVKKIQGVWHGLLILQHGSNKWGFPKGSKTYMKEPLHTCAKRELAEEAGLFIELSAENTYITVHNTAYFVIEPKHEQITIFRHLKTKDSKEIDAIAWMPIQPNSTETHHKSLIRIAEQFDTISIESLSLPPKRYLRHQCIRSKWLPTKFFQKTQQGLSHTRQFWR